MDEFDGFNIKDLPWELVLKILAATMQDATTASYKRMQMFCALFKTDKHPMARRIAHDETIFWAVQERLRQAEHIEPPAERRAQEARLLFMLLQL
jgi:hypothetical protein